MPCVPYARQGPLLAQPGAVEQACRALLHPGELAPAEAGVVLKLLADMWQADPWRSWPTALVLLRRLSRNPEAFVRARTFDILYNLAVHSDLFPGSQRGPRAEELSDVELWAVGALSHLTAEIAGRGEASAAVWAAVQGTWLHLTSCSGRVRPGCAPFATPAALLACMNRCADTRGEGAAAEHRHFCLLLLERLRLQWTGEEGRPLGEAAAVRAALADTEATSASGGRVAERQDNVRGSARVASAGDGVGDSGLDELAAIGGVRALWRHYAFTADADVKRGMFCLYFADAVATLKARGALRNSRLVEESLRLLSEAGGPETLHTWLLSGEPAGATEFRDAVRSGYRHLPKLRAEELGAVLDQLIIALEKGVVEAPESSVRPDLGASFRYCQDSADTYAERGRTPESWQNIFIMSASDNPEDRAAAEGFAFKLLQARQLDEAFPAFILPGAGGTHIQLFLQALLQGSPPQKALFFCLLHRCVVHHCSSGRQTTAISIISSGMDWVIGTPGISENIIYDLCRLIIGLVYNSLNATGTNFQDLRNAVQLLSDRWAELPRMKIDHIPASLLWRPLKVLAKSVPPWSSRTEEHGILPTMLRLLWAKMGDNNVLDEYLLDSLFSELLESNHAYVACHCAMGLLDHWKILQPRMFDDALQKFKSACPRDDKESPYHQALYLGKYFTHGT